MPTVFDSIRAKVTRAEQLIQDLQVELDGYYTSHPYEIATKDNLERGKRIYYVSKVDDVPLEIAAIAADILQNLRSALDHTAYQIILNARSGARPDWNVYFPIAPSASDYKAALGRNIKDVNQVVKDAFVATEAYKGGKGHALWQLNELNKVDKHHLLIAAGSFVRNVDVSSLFRDMFRQIGKDDVADMIPPVSLRPADSQIAFTVGATVYEEPLSMERARIIRPASDLVTPTGESTFKDDIKITFDVSVNDPGVIECEPIIKTVKDMSNLVGGIVGGFKSLL